MSTKTKTIKMLLYSGSINGVINISNSAWESGKMYAAPRDFIEDLVSRADCKKYGVYLLAIYIIFEYIFLLFLDQKLFL